MTFSERVTSITQDKLLPTIIDSILGSNVLCQRTMGKSPKMWSGETLRKPIKITKSTTGGSFSGMGNFDTSAVETRIRLSFSPKAFYQSVVIPGIEKAVNKTDAQVISLVAASLEEAQMDALDSIGDIYYGTGAGDDFEGLGAIVDDGTSVDSYGGQSRATYSQIAGTVTASGGSLTLLKMANMMASTSASGSARQRPTLIVTNETIWNLYESLLTPTVQANYNAEGYPVVTADSMPGRALRGTQGFNALTYRGVPIVADEKATAQTMFFLNENYLDWYKLTDGDLQSIKKPGNVVEGVYSEGSLSPFQWRGWLDPTNNYGQVTQLLALGNFVSFQPRRHGKLTGITTA